MYIETRLNSIQKAADCERLTVQYTFNLGRKNTFMYALSVILAILLACLLLLLYYTEADDPLIRIFFFYPNRQ